MPNIIADNSFRGTAAFISLDFDATSAQLQVESFNFLPAYTAAPPAVVTASVKLINLIPESESLSAGMHILWMEKFGKSTNFDSLKTLCKDKTHELLDSRMLKQKKIDFKAKEWYVEKKPFRLFFQSKKNKDKPFQLFFETEWQV